LLKGIDSDAFHFTDQTPGILKMKKHLALCLAAIVLVGCGDDKKIDNSNLPPITDPKTWPKDNNRANQKKAAESAGEGGAPKILR
jgi:hypothetical protein